MKKTTVLVTAACGDVGASTVRSLQQEGIYDLVGTDISSYCPVLDELCHFFCVSSAHSPNYIYDLLDICKKTGSKFILPISEQEIAVLSTKRKVFSDHGIHLVINAEKVLDTFFDKQKTSEFISKCGFSTPKSVPLSGYDGSWGFPLIVKSKSGCGSKRLWTAQDENDLSYLKLRDGGELLVQQLIGSADEEFTTGVFCDGQRCESITFQRILGFGGLSRFVKFVEEPYLEEMSKRIAEKINLVGAINIQTRKLGKEFLPFEVNPRLSSTVMFRTLFGFADAHWWIQSFIGHSFHFTKKGGSVGIRCLVEKVFD